MLLADFLLTIYSMRGAAAAGVENSQEISTGHKSGWIQSSPTVLSKIFEKCGCKPAFFSVTKVRPKENMM